MGRLTRGSWAENTGSFGAQFPRAVSTFLSSLLLLTRARVRAPSVCLDSSQPPPSPEPNCLSQDTDCIHPASLRPSPAASPAAAAGSAGSQASSRLPPLPSSLYLGITCSLSSQLGSYIKCQPPIVLFAYAVFSLSI